MTSRFVILFLAITATFILFYSLSVDAKYVHSSLVSILPGESPTYIENGQLRANEIEFHLSTPTNHPRVDMSEDDEEDHGGFFSFIVLAALIGGFFLAIVGITLKQCCCPSGGPRSKSLKSHIGSDDAYVLHESTHQSLGTSYGSTGSKNRQNGVTVQKDPNGDLVRTQSNFIRSHTSLNTALLQQAEYDEENKSQRSTTRQEGEKNDQNGQKLVSNNNLLGNVNMNYNMNYTADVISMDIETPNSLQGSMSTSKKANGKRSKGPASEKSKLL